jgi:hypothetical protein
MLEKELNDWEINPCSRVKQLVDGLKFLSVTGAF